MSTFQLIRFLDYFEIFLTEYQAAPYRWSDSLQERIIWQQILFTIYTLLTHTLETTGQSIPYFTPVLRSKYQKLAEIINNFHKDVVIQSHGPLQSTSSD